MPSMTSLGGESFARETCLRQWKNSVREYRPPAPERPYISLINLFLLPLVGS